MKPSAGKLPASAVLLFALIPLAAFSQNLASQLGTVNRSLDRLTLLPGPYLLSPARGAALPAPDVKVDAAAFRFVPEAGNVKSARERQTYILIPGGTGTLTLRSAGNQFQPPPPWRAKTPPPHADSLRFESTLPATPTALPSGGTAPLKRD